MKTCHNAGDLMYIRELEQRLREANEDAAHARWLIGQLTDESDEADILCNDGFTMSFQKGSRLHGLLLESIKEHDARIAKEKPNA